MALADDCVALERAVLPRAEKTRRWEALCAQHAEADLLDVAQLVAAFVREGLALPAPVLARVVEPALRAGVAAGDPAALRTAALAATLVRGGNLLGTTALDLARRAARALPDDRELGALCLRHLATFFQFCLHELPHTLLFGIRPATAADCTELEAMAEEARAIAARTGEALPDHVGWVRLHADHYRRFLTERLFRTYPEHLAMVGQVKPE